jgi:hypothetical protein
MENSCAEACSHRAAGDHLEDVGVERPLRDDLEELVQGARPPSTRRRTLPMLAAMVSAMKLFTSLRVALRRPTGRCFRTPRARVLCARTSHRRRPPCNSGVLPPLPSAMQRAARRRTSRPWPRKLATACRVCRARTWSADDDEVLARAAEQAVRAEHDLLHLGEPVTQRITNRRCLRRVRGASRAGREMSASRERSRFTLTESGNPFASRFFAIPWPIMPRPMNPMRGLSMRIV